MNPLDQQIRDTRTAATRILDRADAERRELNSEERAEYDRLDAELDTLLSRRDQQQAGTRRQTPPVPPARQPQQAEPLRITYPAAPSWRSLLHMRPERHNEIRPGTDDHKRTTDQYRSQFLRYVASGREQLGLQVAKNTKGGYLAPPLFVAELIKFLDNAVFMRQLARVLPPMSNPTALVPSWDADPGNATWGPEVPASDLSEDDTAAIGMREFIPHLMTLLVKVSNKILRAAEVINPESYLIERIGYKCAVTEEQAYMTGDGDEKPLGIFTASALGINTDRDTTASSTTAFTADDLINCLYSLKGQYQRNATWIMSRTAVRNARKLKDGSGQYLWQNGLGGEPGTILDRPFVMSEYAPSTFTTGLYVAAVGDWMAGYWIADSLAMEVQRLGELYALRNQIGMIVRKETDGAPVLPEACARLKLA